jgi:hypothetical protein
MVWFNFMMTFTVVFHFMTAFCLLIFIPILTAQEGEDGAGRLF